MTWDGMPVTVKVRRIPLDRSKQMHGASTTCMEMSGNGAVTGMGVMVALPRIQLAQHRATSVCCAAAAGSATRGTAAPRSAAGAGPATAATTAASASVAPQDRAEVRSNERAAEQGGPSGAGRRDAASAAQNRGGPRSVAAVTSGVEYDTLVAHGDGGSRAHSDGALRVGARVVAGRAKRDGWDKRDNQDGKSASLGRLVCPGCPVTCPS